MALLAAPLSVATAVAAGIPSNVKTTEAKVENGKLTVTWSAATDDTGIAFYRVYFSHASILENGGDYDDFVRTKGTENTYVFDSLPLSSKDIYVGVLAVNTAGTESEGFETEAHVNVEGVASSTSSSTSVSFSEESSSSSSLSSSKDTQENLPMVITSAQALSETGVVLTFSKNLASRAGTGAFSISESGALAPLNIGAVEVQGNIVLLHTDTLEKGKTYMLLIMQPIEGEDGTILTPGQQPVEFMGFDKEAQPAEDQSDEPAQQMIGDPSNLSLKAVKRKDGTYNIVATWDEAPGKPSAYVLYTSEDGTRFVRSSTLDGTELSATYEKIVGGGQFGLKVTAQGEDGKESKGKIRVIDLPASGLGVLGLLGASGALAAAKTRRRKKLST